MPFSASVWARCRSLLAVTAAAMLDDRASPPRQAAATSARSLGGLRRPDCVGQLGPAPARHPVDVPHPVAGCRSAGRLAPTQSPPPPRPAHRGVRTAPSRHPTDVDPSRPGDRGGSCGVPDLGAHPPPRTTPPSPHRHLRSRPQALKPSPRQGEAGGQSLPAPAQDLAHPPWPRDRGQYCAPCRPRRPVTCRQSFGGTAVWLARGRQGAPPDPSEHGGPAGILPW